MLLEVRQETEELKENVVLLNQVNKKKPVHWFYGLVVVGVSDDCYFLIKNNNGYCRIFKRVERSSLERFARMAVFFFSYFFSLARDQFYNYVVQTTQSISENSTKYYPSNGSCSRLSVFVEFSSKYERIYN